MTTLSVRGVEDKLAEELKRKAKREGASVNATILRILRESLGQRKKPRNVTYDDLDDLAGTWNQKDVDEFRKSISPLEEIDESMWK